MRGTHVGNEPVHSVIRRTYQAAAGACAELVSRVPALEAPFVRIGARAWSNALIGRFYRSTADRLAQRIRRRGSPFRTLSVSGVPLVLDVTEFTTRTLYFGNVPYEPETTRCLLRLLGNGGVFVDIGANHGYFTVLAAALVGPTGRVISFEPNPAVFERLEIHVRLNGFDSRVSMIQAALAEAPSDAVPLFVSQSTDNSGLSSLTPAPATIEQGWLSAERSVPVRAETFDRWLQSSGLARVDLVKLDVEGAEDRVIAGMSGALAAGRIGAVLCETVWDGPAHRALCSSGFIPTRLDKMDVAANVIYLRLERPAA